jgi:hypothetical protein
MNPPGVGYVPTVLPILRRAARCFVDLDDIVTSDRRVCFREVEAASRQFAKELWQSNRRALRGGATQIIGAKYTQEGRVF